MVMSGELVVSPEILVGAGSFAAPYADSLIWAASSVPLIYSLRTACKSEWWALNSPMMMPKCCSNRCSIFTEDPGGHEDDGGRRLLE